VESVIRNSQGEDLRFFFLDNGSTGREVHDYFLSVKAGNPIVFRNDVNRWVYAGWNTVLSEALRHGPEIVCLISSDVMLGKGWAEAVTREIRTGGKRYFLPNGRFTDYATFDQAVEAALPALRTAPEKTEPGRAGWCLFFTPSAVREFLPIPETLKLWYGDDYIHWKLRNAGYSCQAIIDCCAIHFGSKSLALLNGEERNRMIALDKIEYERITGERM
jgi:GT2 family glycosyltransferase